MSAQPGVWLLHEVVEHSVERAGSLQDTGATQLLLADFLACVTGAGASAAPVGWSHDGTCGVAAALAARGHARDLDDVHWSANVHPGSVVWPVVLAMGAEVGATGSQIDASARSGYTAIVSLARILGPAHGQSWHATATCGVLGAAVAAAHLLGLPGDERDWACGHAVAMAAGVGQAILERSATTRFHRVGAAALGIQAARMGQARTPCSARVLEGDRGVLALLAPGRESRLPGAVEDGVEGMSVRLFPTNGLAQAAVALAAELSLDAAGAEPIEVVVELPEAAAAATAGTVGGVWWDLRSAVAAAWTSRDPFALTPSPRSQAVRDRVRVTPSGQSRGTRVSVRTARADLSRSLESPPGSSLTDAALPPLLSRKWDLLSGGGPGGAQRVRALASQVLTDGPTADDLASLLGR